MTEQSIIEEVGRINGNIGLRAMIKDAGIWENYLLASRTAQPGQKTPLTKAEMYVESDVHYGDMTAAWRAFLEVAAGTEIGPYLKATD